MKEKQKYYMSNLPIKVEEKKVTKPKKRDPYEELKNKPKEFLKKNREDRQEDIKKCLIESIKLKVKLKKQLKALRDKKIISETIIRSNLKLTNLDDDTIF